MGSGHLRRYCIVLYYYCHQYVQPIYIKPPQPPDKRSWEGDEQEENQTPIKLEDLSVEETFKVIDKKFKQ